MGKFIRDIKTSVDDKSSISVNSITLLISAGIAAIIGLVVCFILVWDVLTNGYIKTDLLDLGIFLLASGGYVAGSGIPKTVVDSRMKSRSWAVGQRLDVELDNYSEEPRKRSRRKKRASDEPSTDEVLDMEQE